MLFTVEICSCVYYFNTRRSDPALLRLGLVAFLLIDLVAVVAGTAIVWLLTIGGWGNPYAILDTQWLIPLYSATLSIGGFIAQIYLCSRVYRLTKSRVIGAGLFACAITALGSGLSTSATTFASQGNHVDGVRFYIWLATSAAADVSISGVLLVVLWRARREASKFSQSALRTPLTRLMIRTIETGSVTSAVALAALAVHSWNPTSLVSGPSAAVWRASSGADKDRRALLQIGDGILITLGRFYTLTVYFNLFSVQSLKDDNKTSNGGPTTLYGRQHGFSASGFQRSQHYGVDSPYPPVSVNFAADAHIRDKGTPTSIDLSRGQARFGDEGEAAELKTHGFV